MLLKYAQLLASLEILGFSKQALVLANNRGIQMLAQEMTGASFVPEIKAYLEKELTKPEQKYKKGPFRRIDPEKLSEEEKSQIPEVARVPKFSTNTSIADLPFMKETVPIIRE